MDAMQKRKVWQVAVGHGLLSLLVGLVALFLPVVFRSAHDPMFEHLSQMLMRFFYFLQPAYFLVFLKEELAEDLLCSIPLWSLCFGWLYVKFTDWLNHFPVLGKKFF